MNCNICAERDVGPEHDVSEKHLRNKLLAEYATYRKQLAGNRKGAVVTCDVKSSCTTIKNHTDGKIKVSVKPNEEIKFNFTIQNDGKKEKLVINFIQFTHTKLNFDMNNHGIILGCNPVTITPKGKLEKEVSVKFKSPDIGQYETSIIFSLRKPASNESILILRDLIVFVEEREIIHEKITSPYAKGEVMASKLYPTCVKPKYEGKFLIPKNYKSIYAKNLNVGEKASKEDKELCEDIRQVFQTGVTEDNYIQFFHNLLWYEETIIRINLKNYNMSGVPMLFRGNCFELVVPGLSEKRPSLMAGDKVLVKPQAADVMFEAVIRDLQDNVARLHGFHKGFEKYYTYQALFDVRFFMSRLPLERMHQAVNTVVRGCPEQSKVFPRPNKKMPRVKPVQNFFNPLVEDNVEQRSVVEHILAGTSGTAPYLLHGPPGTGKTVTIVEAILQLVHKSSHNRVMVCTDSNMAADNVGTMIIKYLHLFSGHKILLRSNSEYRVWETLPECLHKYSNGKSRDSFVPISIDEFMQYNIVITTLSHAAKFAKEINTKKLKRHITHLFIDEAAQACEPACLIPVCGLLAPAGALVLAGDHMQLGPVVISHNAHRLGLGLSLMERLKSTCRLYSDEFNDPNYIVMLRNNFRSHPDILEIPNELFYHGQLRPKAAYDDISDIDILGERQSSRAIVFHGVLSKEQRIGKSPSYFNNMELEIVQKYITLLINKYKVRPEDIGVVTPYIRQMYLIKKWLERQGLGPMIEVGTVEAFQGKEKRVIIISTVRANCGLLDHDAKFQLGFLVDDKRFNVALTRAKAKAIVIGNPLCLEKDIKWRKYMQKCRELGTYCGYDNAPLHDETVQKDMVNAIMPIMNQMKLETAQA